MFLRGGGGGFDTSMHTMESVAYNLGDAEFVITALILLYFEQVKYITMSLTH